MFFSLIVCTYMRPKAILKLLKSVSKQTLYPNEIIVIDGSTDHDTKKLLEQNTFKHLKYFNVGDADRGLTRQRNYGVKKTSPLSDILCFLDDDVILEQNYFEALISTYTKKTDALAVGGYITNEVHWEPATKKKNNSYFYFDDWMRKEPLRFRVRRVFGLLPDALPGFMPTFSHGRSVSFLPPTDKIYEIEQIMGGVSSYRKKVFEHLGFSKYFEGYGLYEDADFSIRLAKQGKLYLNTAARLEHYHEGSGRPNKFKYGKMVLRNGWYVWRVKYESPPLKAIFKWHATAFLLMIIRLFNAVSSSGGYSAFIEGLGRISGWFSLIFNHPKIE